MNTMRMKKGINYLAVTGFCILLILLMPVLSNAQPSDPGGDPFNGDATPINSNIAVVMVLAFAYGVYRIVSLKKAKSADRGHR